MESLDEYKQIEKYQDLILPMMILCDVCYANKDGGLLFKPYMNLILAKKHLNYIMKNNKSGFDFKKYMKVNFESCLLVAEQFPYGACSIMILLYEDNKY